MLKDRSQRIGCAVLFVACILFLFLGSLLAPLNSYPCQIGQYASTKDCASHNVILVALWEIGKFLDDHGGGITALATAFLTFITWQLAKLGKEQGETTRAQLRAYLSVSVGNALAQHTETGLRFQGDAVLKNNGQTPAYKVTYVMKAAVIPDNLLGSQNFFMPTATNFSSDGLGAGETRIISAVVPHLINEADIEKVKRRDGQALWVWGIVSYEDVFKKSHMTRFCHQLYWIGDSVYGRYDPIWSGSD